MGQKVLIFGRNEASAKPIRLDLRAEFDEILKLRAQVRAAESINERPPSMLSKVDRLA
jgi:hypothetical protein